MTCPEPPTPVPPSVVTLPREIALVLAWQESMVCGCDLRLMMPDPKPAPGVQLGALGWSAAALADLAPRLAGLAAADRQRAAAVVSEAVWQVTIVDATLVRYHHDAYDAFLAGQPAR